jgi:arylsulfatase A-like enzyme
VARGHNAALDWARAGQFFLWVPLFDAHAPYDPPAQFGTRAGGNPYDGEIAYVDAQVGRVLDGLDQRGLLSNTVIAVAGDHREGLGDHGEQTHGMLAYDTTLRVPLIVTGPRLSARVVRAPVLLADLAPSLLSHARTSDLASGRGHRDLFTASVGDSDVYAETLYPRTAAWHPLAVLAGQQFKMIVSSELELYDLLNDPNETRDIAAERPTIVQGMSSRLKELQSTATTGTTAHVSGEAAERLRALGYIGAPAGTAADEPDAPNPTRLIERWTRFERALGMVNSGRAAEALPILKDLAA